MLYIWSVMGVLALAGGLYYWITDSMEAAWPLLAAAAMALFLSGVRFMYMKNQSK